LQKCSWQTTACVSPFVEKQGSADLDSGQYIYKLSKTKLKHPRTSAHVDFKFTFGANTLQQDRERSMFTATPKPIQSPSPYSYGVRNEASRKSMGPPSSRANGGLLIDPALTAPIPTPANNRGSSSQSAEPITEEKIYMQERNLIIQKLAEQDKKLTKMAASIDDWKIQNGRLLAAFMRSSPEALTEQNTSGVLETLIDDFEVMVNAAYEARSSKDELEVLKAENDAMKAKLQSIALAMDSGTRDITPALKPLTSPTAASRTSSVLGKRKRIDARSRHSLLQNEVSVTDEDDLNDQSGLYDISSATNMGCTPARQSERPSTPLSNTRVSQQYRQAPAMTTFSSINPPPAPTVAGQTLAETTDQVLTPPDSTSAEKHGRGSLSTEPDNSLGVALECSGIAAHEADGSTGEASEDSGPGETTNSPDVADHQAAGTIFIGNVASDGHEGPSRIVRPQRARKPTPKVADTSDTEEVETAAGLAKKQQNSGAIELRSRGMRASAADASRRKTTSALPQESATEPENDERNSMKSQRRRTTNRLPEVENVDIRERRSSSNVTRPQRMTRASASQFDFAQEDGYGEVNADVTEEGAEEGIGQNMSLMTVDIDEEREELFQPRQADRHDMQMNGNNKKNKQLIYATSADGTQSKQPYRRNRDPNKPKRIRRKPAEIERKYKCLFPGCTKAYGGLPHLNTHIVDSNHGEKWSKVDYVEASKQVSNLDEISQPETRHGNHLPATWGQGDMINLDDSLAEERHAEDAGAELRRNQEQVDRVEKIRQRDRRAKEAMEREEMMELMNNV
jgi:hypothetical protein